MRKQFKGKYSKLAQVSRNSLVFVEYFQTAINKEIEEAKRNKWANEWMNGGGREKGGRSLDQEIKISKDILHAKTEAKKGGYTPWYERMAAEAREKEEEDGKEGLTM